MMVIKSKELFWDGQKFQENLQKAIVFFTIEGIEKVISKLEGKRSDYTITVIS